MNLPELRTKLSKKSKAFVREMDAIGDRVGLGFHFRHARVGEELTQAQLAEALGLKVSDIRSVESGSPEVSDGVRGSIAQHLMQRLIKQGVSQRWIGELTGVGAVSAKNIQA